MSLKLLAGSFLLFAAGLYAAQTMPGGVKEMKADSGTTVLADSKGMTLYTYSKDETGKSMCNGTCATNWPPLMASADAKSEGDWTVVTRVGRYQTVGLQGRAALYVWPRYQKGRDQGQWHGQGSLENRNTVTH